MVMSGIEITRDFERIYSVVIIIASLNSTAFFLVLV
jgi:hypothetical protein